MLVLIEVLFQKCFDQKLYSLFRKSFQRFIYLSFFIKWFLLINNEIIFTNSMNDLKLAIFIHNETYTTKTILVSGLRFPSLVV